MRHSSLRGKQRKSSMPGRKFIMAVVVLTSAFSFTFGYFVGKALHKEKQPQPQKIALSFHQEPQPRESGEQSTQTDENPPEAEQVKDANLSDDKALPLQAAAVKKEDSLPQPSSIKGAGLPGKKESKSVQNADNAKSNKAVIYTVQAGAFKNLKEAENLKRRLENKGYKAYIKKYPAARNMKLFKVRIGEFSNKQDAEDAALKLKKTEKLKAFVTFMANTKQEVKNRKNL